MLFLWEWKQVEPAVGLPMMVAIRLPYSGIELNISTAEYTYAVSNSKNFKGVVPDMIIPPTKEELIKKQVDFVMDKAIDLIKSEKQ